MSRQEIRVTFNPVPTAEARFAFSPERAVLEGETAIVDVILHTEGPGSAMARFSKSEGIRWIHEGPQDLEQTLNSAGTVLTLRGFPRNETQESIDYDYAVTVEYKGKRFSSESQYPVMACVPTGGG